MGFHSVRIEIQVLGIGKTEARLEETIPGLLGQPPCRLPDLGILAMPPTPADAQRLERVTGRPPEFLRRLDVVAIIEKPVSGFEKLPCNPSVLLLLCFRFLHTLILPYGAQYVEILKVRRTPMGRREIAHCANTAMVLVMGQIKPGDKFIVDEKQLKFTECGN